MGSARRRSQSAEPGPWRRGRRSATRQRARAQDGARRLGFQMVSGGSPTVREGTELCPRPPSRSGYRHVVRKNKVSSQTGMTRVTTRTLVLLFIAFLALAAGAFNLRDRLNQRPVYSDGVLWRDVEGLDVFADKVEPGGASSDAAPRLRSYVVADGVEPNGPAALAGVYRGDVLLGISVNGDDWDEIFRAEHVQIYLDQVKGQPGFPDSVNLHYYVARRNDKGDAVIKDGFADLQNLQARDPHTRRDLYLALIGLIYLGIGVYFLLKQGGAPYVTRFFIICLLSFIAHFYSPTQEMSTQFDKGIDLADAIALALLGPFFVHFAALYPLRKRIVARSRWLSRAV